MSHAKSYEAAIKVGMFLGWAGLATLSCGGSSREPLAASTAGQAGTLAAASGGSAGVARAEAGATAHAGSVALGGASGTGGGSAAGSANADAGTAGAAPLASHAEQLAAVVPYCNALATICPNFEAATCARDGSDRLPQQGELCYAEQVRRNMCTLLQPADNLECSSASSGRAKPGFCDAEQASVLACLAG